MLLVEFGDVGGGVEDDELAEEGEKVRWQRTTISRKRWKERWVRLYIGTDSIGGETPIRGISQLLLLVLGLFLVREIN